MTRTISITEHERQFLLRKVSADLVCYLGHKTSGVSLTVAEEEHVVFMSTLADKLEESATEAENRGTEPRDG